MSEAPVDWAEVHRRVEAARQALERGWAPAAGQTRHILRERAKALSAEAAEAPAGAAPLGVLVFLLSDETYAIELPFVREVFPLRAFTTLPCTPPFVLGLANVRGRILSIIDLRKFFELPEKGATEQNRLVVLQRGDMELNILAEAVLGVSAIRPDELQATLPTLTGVRETYFKGVTAGRLVLLDGERLLSGGNLVVNEHVEG